MKNTIRIAAALLIAASGFTACNQKMEVAQAGEGSLSLGVDIQGTKAALSAEDLLSTASVKIYKDDFSGLVRSYVYGSAPEKIFLPAEGYRVDVEAGELPKASPVIASWEQKSYKGSKEFTVRAGQTTQVQVTAYIANVVSKVAFDASVAENFKEGYTFTIGLSATDPAQQLVYDAATDGQEGYFLPSEFEPSLFWSFTGILKKDNSNFSKSGEIQSVEKGKLYSMKPKFTVRDGDLGFDLKVDYSSTQIISDLVVFEPVSTGLAKSAPHEIWAAHATVHADVDESEYSDPTKIAFAYSTDGTDWTTVAATRASEGVYDAVLTGLDGATTYSYKLVIDGEDVGESANFTTEAARQLPNGNFETISNAESSNWTSFYDPASSEPELKSKFWDNGSSASAGIIGSPSAAICYTDTDVPAGTGSTRSARLQSKSVAGKMAAGNLFTGEFAGTEGMDGKVNFGRPWNTRPTAVRLWYKYLGGKVTNTNADAPITTNDYDICSIQIAIGTWNYKTFGGTTNSPVQVFTKNKSTFWKYDEIVGTIAYGKFEETGTGSAGEWKQITIPFEYKSYIEFPTHIIVSCAASKYGDYFAGSSSSALWIDEVELIYE